MLNRVEPPHTGTEAELLRAFLDYYRDTLLLKMEGLDREQLTRRLVASDTTLLGIVKHMAYVERGWFRRTLNNQIFPVPWTDEDPDADFRVEPEETPEEIIAFYRQEVAEARLSAEGHSLDDLAKRSDRPVSLRWIYIHMIEETARHCGHADILRELIDGATGE